MHENVLAEILTELRAIRRLMEDATPREESGDTSTFVAVADGVVRRFPSESAPATERVRFVSPLDGREYELGRHAP